jgi:sugar lactone lactonase YvrE
MSYLTTLSNVYNIAASASNQVYTGLISVDSNNSTTLAMTSAWSTISPAYIYYPNQAIAIDGANIDSVLGVELDTNSNMYVSGTYNTIPPTIYNSNATSSGLVLPSNGQTAAFAVKYDSTGTALFTVAVDGTGNETGNSVTVDTIGSIVLAGSYDTASPTIYNASNITSTTVGTFPTPIGNKSAYIVKYDNKGTALWNTVVDSAGADGVNSIAMDISNNIVVAGSYIPVSAPINTTQLVVSTVAGSGAASYGDGIGINSGFTYPCGVTVDSLGNIYVADTNVHRIRKITSAGVVTTLAGKGTPTYLDATGTNAGLSYPTGVTVDSDGNVYVADKDNHRIRKITSVGVVTTFAGKGTVTYIDGIGTNAGFNIPYGITIDSIGNLYVAEWGGNRIRKITSAGVVSTLAGSGIATFLDGIGTNAGFNIPLGVAVDSNGNVYVAENTNRRIRKIDTTGVVTTFAGSGTASSVNGIGTNASFNYPRGIAIDSVGNIYLGDTGSINFIRKITPSQVVTTFAGSGATSYGDGIGTNSGFNNPWGFVVDSIGNLYVADTYNQRIRKITNTIVNVADQNTVTTLAGSGTATYLDATGTNAGFNLPRDIAIDSVGNMYIVEWNNHRIRKITSAGVITTFAGSGTATFLDATGTNAGFKNPTGIVIDSIGNIYVADFNNQRIRKITTDGVVTSFAGGNATLSYADGTGTNVGFSSPLGVAIDSLGNIYVAEYGNHRIRKITSAGVVSTFAGSGTTAFLDATGTNASFYRPYGIAVDSTGNVYVADSSNYRIRKITSAGVVTTLAGKSTATFVDGVGTNAGFWVPQGVTVDSAGNVYVADTGNNRIRKITSAGVVTTLAGGLTGTTGTFADGIGTNAGFSNPIGLTVDYIGNIYVADTNNNLIRKLTGPIIAPTVYDANIFLDTTNPYKISTIGEVSTIAGSGTATYLDGTGTNVGFNTPTGIFIDSLGNMYIAEFVNNRIRKITSAGVVTTIAGSGATGSIDATGTNATFNNPYGITIDYAGNIYVVDSANNRIRKITSDGVVTTFAGSGTGTWLDGIGINACFKNPLGITIDPSGNVYVGDCYNHRIRKITSAGVVTTFAGSGTGTYLDATGTNAGFNMPVGVSIDFIGNLYVADYGNNRIRKITSAGVVTTIAGNGATGCIDATGTNAVFYNPRGVAVDFVGNMYVSDTNNDRIRKITSTGVVTTLAGSGAQSYGDGVGTNSGFNLANDIAVDLAGNVYLPDQGNHRIRRIETLGVGTSNFAGSGTATYLDGIGINAGFNNSYGLLTMDSANNMYVADAANNRIRKITSAGVVTTLAGNGATGCIDATGTNAVFYTPRGVAIDSSGNLYITDMYNHRIRKITSDGVVTTIAGSGAAISSDGIGTNASFCYPYGIVLDSNSNIYVTDYNGQRIRKITSTGVVTTIAGSTATYIDATGTNAGFNGPRGLTIDSAGNLYVIDQGNQRIRKITSAGVVTTFAGGSSGTTGTFVDGLGTNAGFNSPYGMTIDSLGNLYVADTTNFRIRKITPSQVVSSISSIQAYGITVDSLGNIYVGNSSNRIQQISAPVAVSTIAGSGTATYLDGIGTNASFNRPSGVVVDSIGNIYVAEALNHRIRKITSTGVVTTFAGSGTATYLDGIGTNAGFNVPWGIAIDSTGNLYVGEQSNHRIRKITSTGVVTTLAGKGTATYVDGIGTNAGFNGPAGVAVDSFGNVYVADYSNNRIRKITSAGVVTTLAGKNTATYVDGIGTNAGFNIPTAVGVDSIGNVYVCDLTNDYIRKIDSTGVVTTLAGKGTGTYVDGIGTNAGFNAPRGIVIDCAGNIYVNDSSNNRIRKITSAGVVSTLAGGNATLTYIDSTGTNAGFNLLHGIALDSIGNLYIADYNNSRIRKVTFPYPQVQGNTIITSPSVTIPTGSTVNPAAFAIKYNSSGVSQWSAVLDGTLTDSSSSVTTDINGNVYVAGMYGSVQPTMYSNYVGLVSTYVGSGANAYLDGIGTNAKFGALYGIAVDSTGNLYVPEYTYHRIRKIDSAGVVTTLAGSGTATYKDGTGTNAGFNAPYGIAIDSVGNLYIGDGGNHRIRKITSAGVVTTLAGSGATGSIDATGTNASFNLPRGVAVDSTGNVYVADMNNIRIRKITSDGVVTTFAGGNATLTYLDSTGTNAGFNLPRGVTTDSSGNVYVADTTNHRIRKIDSAGVVTTLAGSGTATYLDGIGTNAAFNNPWGITIDSTGNLYVTDATNYRIRKVTSEGVVTTLAGKGTATYLIGTGTNAGFNSPTSIAVDSSGVMYITDQNNYRIRKIGITNPALPTTTTTGNAAFGIKLDSSGYSQWLVAADGINNEQALGCATDTSGNFYLTGSYGSNVATIYSAYDATSSITLPTASNTSAFVIKYDKYGNALWSGTVTTDSNAVAYNVATDAFNNVYMAGSYQGITAPIVYGSNNAYNPNADLPYPTGNNGSNTASFIVKYDSNGTPQNAWGIMGSSNSSSYSISVDTYGSNISLAGMFTGSTTLYDGNNAISSLAFPSGISTQAGFAVNYDIAQSPVTLISNLGNGNNGQKKYITNTGSAPLTLNITSSNNSSILSTYTINAGSNLLFNWYNGSWYKMI